TYAVQSHYSIPHSELVKLQQLSMQQQGLASISQSATVLPAVEANSQTTSQELLIPNDVRAAGNHPEIAVAPPSASSAPQLLADFTLQPLHRGDSILHSPLISRTVDKAQSAKASALLPPCVSGWR
ncbi:hypothetical protein ATANTOWER_023044, partial [Ataeniobius toweri]|nr:hypothetical protein [Ataeniobius toweri]